MKLVINPAVGCHYFLPGPRLPSQQERHRRWLESVCTAWWTGVHACERRVWGRFVTEEWPRMEPANSRSLVQHPVYCATTFGHRHVHI